jgi:4-hydroxy-tetrahydrodipicolinate synthase
MKPFELLTRQSAANLHCIPAMPTVYASNGVGPEDAPIDFKQQARLIDHLIDRCHNDAILVAGTTGEPATMSHEEQLSYISWTIGQVNGRVPVFAGTGANSTSEAIWLTRKAAAAGANAVLIVKPYYNNPTPAGILAHFRAIAKLGIPFISYSVSARTGGGPIPVEVIVQLAKEFPHYIGHKEAEGDPARFAALRRQCPPDFIIWSGDDGITAEVMAAGHCDGVISVASCITDQVKAMVDAFATAKCQDDQIRGIAIQHRLETLFGKLGLFLETNPLGVKEALALMKVIEQACFRLPLVPMRQDNAEILRLVLVDLKLIPSSAN